MSEVMGKNLNSGLIAEEGRNDVTITEINNLLLIRYKQIKWLSIALQVNHCIQCLFFFVNSKWLLKAI